MSNKQSGGVVSFIIVAIALAGLLASGLYYSKHQARVARESDTSQPQVNTPAEAPAKNEQKPEDKKEDKPVATAPTQQQNNQTQPKPQNNTPSDTAKPKPEAKPDSGSSRQEAPKTTPTTGPSSLANTGPSELPETGPAGTLASILALAGLTFVGYRLSQSHRNLRRSALKQ